MTLSRTGSPQITEDRQDWGLDTGAYHCQQAAEKALKGWLTSRKIEVRKTHDLVELVEQCASVHPPFTSLRDPARALVPFAVQFRYPGDLFEPPMDEAVEALNLAAAIFQAVLASLKEAHPDSMADG